MVGDGSIVRIYPCYDDLIDVVYFNPIGHKSKLKGGGMRSLPYPLYLMSKLELSETQMSHQTGLTVKAA